MGSYRLLDATPVDAAEKESLGRRPRTAQASLAPRTASRSEPGSARYSDFGRAVVDRLVELGREAAEMRAALRTAREEARDARQARDEAESRARALAEKVRELEARAEMAESNLRTLLATVRGQERRRPRSRCEGVRLRDGSDPRGAEGRRRARHDARTASDAPAS